MIRYTKFQKSFKKEHSIQEQVSSYFRKIPFIGNINFSKEIQLISLFGAMFLVIIFRLFYLQIIQHDKYNTELIKQSTSLASIKSERGDIYALDKSGQPVKLTENINLYDVALDPREIGVDGNKVRQKDRFIELISPIVYKHLCEIHGMDNIEGNTEECIKNIESFSNLELFPKEPEIFYYGKDYDAEGNEHPVISEEYSTFDYVAYNQEKQKIIDEFSKEQAMEIIRKRLDEKIKIGKREKNLVGYYTNEDFLKDLESQNFNFVSIEANFYVYIVPSKSKNSYRDKALFQTFMNKYKEALTSSKLDYLFKEQEYKYIKLFSSANPQIAQDIKQLKIEYANEKYSLDDSIYNKYSIVHGIILEPNSTRYYPYGEFMSNILGYVNKNGVAYYGIEKYFDSILQGIDGKIIGRSSRNMGGNDFEVINTKDGDDVVLTVDIGIQKEVESIAKKYLESLRADSIAIMVFDPNKGEVKASASLPTYNPNNYNDAYTMMPLGPDYAYILDNESYNEVPIYIYSGGKYIKATSDDRKDTTLKKYISKNVYGPQVFIDKNISSVFEPGSIFKSFTMAIGLDSDEVRLNDQYQDDGSIKIDIYTINDADKSACVGYHTLLEALVNSCNVGMIKIVQALGKEIFYNYLVKFGFGEPTGIELAEEKNGSLPNLSNVSMAAFFNNSFGQGVTVTQIQLASAYATLINGGKYIKPTIISQIRKKTANSDDITIQNKTSRSIRQILRPEVSEEMRNALYSVIETNNQYERARVNGYRLGAKSGTSQVAYKGKYRKGVGWTQATFAGIVSIDNPEYVVLIWVSRPRSNQWGVYTAGKIFGEIAEFLIGYSMME